MFGDRTSREDRLRKTPHSKKDTRTKPPLSVRYPEKLRDPKAIQKRLEEEDRHILNKKTP